MKIFLVLSYTQLCTSRQGITLRCRTRQRILAGMKSTQGVAPCAALAAAAAHPCRDARSRPAPLPAQLPQVALAAAPPAAAPPRDKTERLQQNLLLPPDQRVGRGVKIILSRRTHHSSLDLGVRSLTAKLLYHLSLFQNSL